MTATNVTVPGGLTIHKGLPRQALDRVVSGVLRSPLHRLGGFSEAAMLLTFRGRRSGKRYTLPLTYMREGDEVVTFALFTNTVWWKNLRGGVDARVRLRGRDLSGVARVIEDPEEVARGLLAMAEANPGMTRRGHYAVPRTAAGEPDGDALLEAARTRVMIRVALKDDGFEEGRS